MSRGSNNPSDTSGSPNAINVTPSDFAGSRFRHVKRSHTERDIARFSPPLAFVLRRRAFLSRLILVFHRIFRFSSWTHLSAHLLRSMPIINAIISSYVTTTPKSSEVASDRSTRARMSAAGGGGGNDVDRSAHACE
jgi:hypothetical protein